MARTVSVTIAQPALHPQPDGFKFRAAECAGKPYFPGASCTSQVLIARPCSLTVKRFVVFIDEHINARGRLSDDGRYQRGPLDRQRNLRLLRRERQTDSHFDLASGRTDRKVSTPYQARKEIGSVAAVRVSSLSIRPDRGARRIACHQRAAPRRSLKMKKPAFAGRALSGSKRACQRNIESGTT